MGYDLSVVETASGTEIAANLVNSGELGAHFQARFLNPAAPPCSYTVGAGDRLRVRWPAAGPYDITLHGANGFYRRYTGDRTQDHVTATMHHEGGRISLVVAAEGAPEVVTMTSPYGARRPQKVRVAAGSHHEFDMQTRATGGWYDLTLSAADSSFKRQFAGHLEEGNPRSATRPSDAPSLVLSGIHAAGVD